MYTMGKWKELSSGTIYCAVQHSSHISVYSQSSRKQPPSEFEKVIVTRAGRNKLL